MVADVGKSGKGRFVVDFLGHDVAIWDNDADRRIVCGGWAVLQMMRDFMKVC